MKQVVFLIVFVFLQVALWAQHPNKVVKTHSSTPVSKTHSANEPALEISLEEKALQEQKMQDSLKMVEQIAYENLLKQQAKTQDSLYQLQKRQEELELVKAQREQDSLLEVKLREMSEQQAIQKAQQMADSIVRASAEFEAKSLNDPYFGNFSFNSSSGKNFVLAVTDAVLPNTNYSFRLTVYSKAVPVKLSGYVKYLKENEYGFFVNDGNPEIQKDKPYFIWKRDGNSELITEFIQFPEPESGSVCFVK